MRHVRFIRWGLVALLVATLALTVGGLRLARPAQGGVDRPTYSRAAAPAPVVHQNAVPFFRNVFAVRNSRLVRDRLDGATVDANILGVPAIGSVTLPDPVRRVVVLPERTDHAGTTILVVVPGEGVLFVNGDTYTPTAPPGPGSSRSVDRGAG